VGDIEVLPALQGGLGLELARAHHPDLILLDLHLPDMAGEDVAMALRADESTRAIPIVVLSADAYSSQRDRLLALGVDAYMTKPFKVAEMIALIERFVGR
jgi:CheY-like chemotaxis protein